MKFFIITCFVRSFGYYIMIIYVPYYLLASFVRSHEGTINNNAQTLVSTVQPFNFEKRHLFHAPQHAWRCSWAVSKISLSSWTASRQQWMTYAPMFTCLGHVQVLVLIFFSQTNRLARDRRTRDVFPQKTTWSCFPSLKVFSILSLSFVFHSQHSSITATGRSLHGAKHLEQERVSREPEPFSRE